MHCFSTVFSADGNYEVSYRSNVIVYPDGAVNWIPPSIYKSSCTIDVQVQEVLLLLYVYTKDAPIFVILHSSFLI